MAERPSRRVLFVCVQNAGRSQMAAGLVKLRSEGRIHVRSAGSAPGEEINPAVVEAMTELGVDMSEEFPKPLTDEVVESGKIAIPRAMSHVHVGEERVTAGALPNGWKLP